MRRRLFSGYILLFLLCVFSRDAGYSFDEQITPQGKIITGMSQPQALLTFGVPVSASDNLWYYSDPQSVYVYFDRPLQVHLYPQFCKGYVGDPLELRVFAGAREAAEVTSLSALRISDPEKFARTHNGVVIPQKPGEYQIIAVYKGVYSNASFISIMKERKKDFAGEELSGIDILPYKPLVNLKSPVEFFALATFETENGNVIRDISNKAEWFIERNNEVENLRDSRVVLNSPGRARVFCRFKGRQSYAQDIQAQGRSSDPGHSLKHIAIIPAFRSLLRKSGFFLYAFATYTDNRVEEVTKRVTWDIKNHTILTKAATGMFLAKAAGITDVYAELNSVKSLPAKVMVYNIPAQNVKGKKSEEQENVGQEEDRSHEKKERNEESQDLLQALKKDVEDLKNAMLEKGKFQSIKIVPDYADIAQGEEKQFSAFGVRQDASEEDITILAQWQSFQEKTVTVSRGLTRAIWPGQTVIQARYKDIESRHIPIVVQEPRLISITVSPLYVRIVMGGQVSLKAQGYFSDSSRKDITSVVTWVCAKPGIVKVTKDTFSPLRLGQVKIFAEYSGKQSPPAQIDVIREKYWLWKRILIIALFLFAATLILFGYFYLITEGVKKSIIALYGDPNAFIVALYGNLNNLLVVFGMQQEFYQGPLSSASLTDKKYAVQNNLFLRFAQRFEEAKYSTHIFPQEESGVALQEYQGLLKIIFSQCTKRIFVYNYIKALMLKVPFSIPEAPPLL